MSDLSSKTRPELDALATDAGLDPTTFGTKPELVAALESNAATSVGPTRSQREEDARVIAQTTEENRAEFSDAWESFTATGKLPAGYRYSGSRFATLVK